MNSSVQFGSRRIDFHLEYADRKTLGITVTPEMRVVVKAPSRTALEKVHDKVRRRAPWILRQQSYFLSFEPRTPRRRYVSGETHLYLGRHYTLRILRGRHEKVRLSGGHIEVTSADIKRVPLLLKMWYRERAAIRFAPTLQDLLPRFRKQQVQPSGVLLRDMPYRWGSCTPRGNIILNPELVKAPRACIEYVITHELCHLVHRNHDAKFIQLQEQVMPDWEKWKRRLEKVMA